MTDLKWTSCCKGRQGCPEIAVAGNSVHIKDDFGNQVVVDRDSFPIFGEESASGNKGEIMLQIYGEESEKPPARMTLEQFYDMLETLDTWDASK